MKSILTLLAVGVMGIAFAGTPAYAAESCCAQKAKTVKCEQEKKCEGKEEKCPAKSDKCQKSDKCEKSGKCDKAEKKA